MSALYKFQLSICHVYAKISVLVKYVRGGTENRMSIPPLPAYFDSCGCIYSDCTLIQTLKGDLQRLCYTLCMFVFYLSLDLSIFKKLSWSLLFVHLTLQSGFYLIWLFNLSFLSFYRVCIFYSIWFLDHNAFGLGTLNFILLISNCTVQIL